MDNSCKNAPPIIVQTKMGHTVFYKERFLYSKYNPSKEMKLSISSIKDLEKTLFIFASPLLAFEFSSFIDSLPPSSFLFFLECDALLGKMFEEHFFNNLKKIKPRKKNIDYICTQDVNSALRYIEKTTKFSFKKVQMIKCSGGFSLYQQFYVEIVKRIEDAICIFWKNRITLIEMGSLYSRNIFKWLSHIAKDGKNIEKSRFKVCKKNTVALPIIVCGAGPSLQESYSFILKNRERFFVLAVDAALPSLQDAGIESDGVVLLEGQYWVEKAFFSAKSKKINLFASLTSNPHVYNILDGDVFLYATEFSKSAFLEKIRSLCPNIPFFAPLGSVGLQALDIANFIARNGVPIFHTGLDFSYSKGFTHATSSMPVQNLLISNNRFDSLYRGENIFPLNFQVQKGKNGEDVCTTPALLSYANIYRQNFSNMQNIFDVTSSGLALKEACVTLKELELILDSFICNNKEAPLATEVIEPQNAENILLCEKNNLQKIKNALTGFKELEPHNLIELLKSTDYLYLHFPDYPFLDDDAMLSLSFLKRIRIELEYFLKIHS